MSIPQHVIRELQKCFQQVFPEIQLVPFGSSASGFDMANSDVDLCAIFPERSEEYLMIHSEEEFPSVSRVPRLLAHAV